jgi:small subunit ribosomal protein S18
MAFKKDPRKKGRKPVKRQARKGACRLCKSGEVPDYKAFEQLAQFTSDRGRILGRRITDTCSKHQRLLTKEIKRARHLALLKFVAKA